MTPDAKMASEGTFEPCENGTNDLAVQRSLSIWSNVFSIDMPTFKISKKANIDFFYQEGLNKAFSHVIEHQISLQ